MKNPIVKSFIIEKEEVSASTEVGAPLSSRDKTKALALDASIYYTRRKAQALSIGVAIMALTLFVWFLGVWTDGPISGKFGASGFLLFFTSLTFLGIAVWADASAEDNRKTYLTGRTSEERAQSERNRY